MVRLIPLTSCLPLLLSWANKPQAIQHMLVTTPALHLAAVQSILDSELSSGRATKLTAPNGLPGQITLVRSPNGIKAASAQLTELQQQHSQQQQLSTEQQHHEQLPAEQQQHSNKGQRSHRLRKAKVPAVAQVIAEPDVARVVQNAVDVSHNKDSKVPSRAQEVAGSSCSLLCRHKISSTAAGLEHHCIHLHLQPCIHGYWGVCILNVKPCMPATGQARNANLEEHATLDSVQHKGPSELSKAKGLNAFMAAKLANAIGKGTTVNCLAGHL